MLIYQLFPPVLFFIIPRTPSSTLFPTRRSSDLNLLRNRSKGRAPIGNRTCLTLLTNSRRGGFGEALGETSDRKSTRLNSSHVAISYAVFCLKKKKKNLTEVLYQL